MTFLFIWSRYDRKHAVITGAGPAGLTVASELLDKTGITAITLEKPNDTDRPSKNR